MALDKQKIASVFEWLNRWVVVLAIALPVLLCITIAVKGGQKPPWLDFLNLPTTLLFFSLAVLLTRGLYLVFDHEHHEWEDFQAEFRFAVFHAGTGWSMGIFIASFLAGLYFMLPDAKAHERFTAAFGIYFGVLGVTMAIHAFYRQYAPITNLDFLLLRLIDDLKNKDRCYRLYFTYPALNIGYYRHRKAAGKDAKLHNTDIFWKFLEALRESGPRCRTKVKLVTYPLAEYKKLYDAYSKMASTDPQQPETDIATDAARNAGQLVEDVIGGDFRYGGLSEIKPQEFPQHCIIVGDIIYTIVTFNLPIYNPAKDDFEPVRKSSDHEKLADLYVYRRQDKGFADAVARHLDELIGLRGKELKQDALATFLRSQSPASATPGPAATQPKAP